MRNSFVGYAAAGVFAASAGVWAQPPSTPSPTGRPPVVQSATVTVEGCVTREQDVPGRKPNVAERAGVMEDYLLTNAKIVKGSAPAGMPKVTMYEIEGVGDETLKQHVGKRVQLEGTLENTDRATAQKEAGTPADDLVEIRGTTVKQVEGTCPRKSS